MPSILRARADGRPKALPLCCSFCRKPQSSVQKLISSPPSDDSERAYICDECIAVCASILADDREVSSVNTLEPESHESHPLLNHSLTPRLLVAVERWIRQESLGADSAEELAEVKSIAERLVCAGTQQ
jgi:hypothetical protein